MSYGIAASFVPDFFAEAEQYYISRRNDAMWFAATGNDGAEVESYPACLDGVIGVGATDTTGGVSDFSTFGKVVDLVAPGDNVISTIPLANTITDDYYTRRHVQWHSVAE
jgi:subtilisin family serine protease